MEPAAFGAFNTPTALFTNTGVYCDGPLWRKCAICCAEPTVGRLLVLFVLSKRVAAAAPATFPDERVTPSFGALSFGDPGTDDAKEEFGEVTSTPCHW